MKYFILLFTIILSSNIFSKSAVARLKDLVTIKGVRQNPIVGYGLVVGLNGTGDSGGEITNASLLRMFQKLGLNPKNEISSKNVAAVIVTAKLPPFARIGQRVDTTVSSIGDASSLAGGNLLVTPLKAGDGNVYAVASGSISIGGLNKGKSFATVGNIPDGAIVEKELDLKFDEKKSIRMGLKIPDFTTSARIQKTINKELGGKFAISRDSATIDLIIPVNYQRKVVELIAILENFKIAVDSIAKIVINEKTGSIVAGGDIVLRPVAIAHKNLTIEIGEGNKGGKKKDKGDSFYHIKDSSTLNDLVQGLNAFGADPEDIITIFQLLKRNGSLMAEIEMI